MAYSMEMQAQAALDVETTQQIERERAWREGLKAARYATEDAKEKAEARQATKFASTIQAHHDSQMTNNPTYAK